MGTLERIPTPSIGGDTTLDVYNQEIGLAYDELNRQTDSLDALNNIFKILTYSTLTIIWNGSIYPPGLAAPGTGVVSTYLAYFIRSDRPGQLYQLPYYEFDGSGNLIFSVTSYYNNGIAFQVMSSVGGTPASVQISYYVLSQPTGVSS